MATKLIQGQNYLQIYYNLFKTIQYTWSWYILINIMFRTGRNQYICNDVIHYVLENSR